MTRRRRLCRVSESRCCDALLPLLAGWLDGGLEGAAAAQVRRHLPRCPVCSSRLVSVLDMVSMAGRPSRRSEPRCHELDVLARRVRQRLRALVRAVLARRILRLSRQRMERSARGRAPSHRWLRRDLAGALRRLRVLDASAVEACGLEDLLSVKGALDLESLRRGLAAAERGGWVARGERGLDPLRRGRLDERSVVWARSVLDAFRGCGDGRTPRAGRRARAAVGSRPCRRRR